MLETAYVFTVRCLFDGGAGRRQLLCFAFEKQNKRAWKPIVVSRNRFHLKIGPVRSAIEANEYRRRQDRFAAFKHRTQGCSQFLTEFLAHKVGHVGAQRPGLRLQKAAGAVER